MVSGWTGESRGPGIGRPATAVPSSRSSVLRSRARVLWLAAGIWFALMAACDEGEDTVVAPAVTGTISGVVTVEGTAASGVSVQLSSGQSTTTDASGAYSFTDVPAGAYTVSISGGPSDVTFPSTSQAATISSSGQVVTVNFDGDRIRTSGVSTTVTVDGELAEGVAVAVRYPDGTEVDSGTTNGDGVFAVSGLVAGEYSVEVTPPGGAECDQPDPVTVEVGESAEVDVACTTPPPPFPPAGLFFDFTEADADEGTVAPGSSFTTPLRDSEGEAQGEVTTELEDDGQYYREASGEGRFFFDAPGGFRMIFPGAMLQYYQTLHLYWAVSQFITAQCVVDLVLRGSGGNILSTQSYTSQQALMTIQLVAAVVYIDMVYRATQGGSCSNAYVGLTGGELTNPD